MSDYDNDLIEQMVRDGIRTRDGQHVREPGMPTTVLWGCSRCMDQGCDFCNDRPIPDDVWMSLVEWREDDGDGERDQGLDR